MTFHHFHKWLINHSDNDDSIEFWEVFYRKKRKRKLRKIIVQGNIYTALLFFFDHFYHLNIPFLSSTLEEINNISNDSNDSNASNEYYHLVEKIVYGYDDNNISVRRYI